MIQKKLFESNEKPKNQVLEIEITPDVIIFYNKYLTADGLVTEQVIKRRVSLK